MRTAKSVFGVVWALGPILYCWGLAYHFFDISGSSVEEVEAEGLGPTVLGLAVVGLLFCIPFIWKLVRLLTSPRSSGPGGRSGPDTPPPDDEDGFDADAAIARYLAQRSTEGVVSGPASTPSKADGPAKRPGFGRRSR